MTGAPALPDLAAPMFSSAVFGVDIPLVDERGAVQLLIDLGELDPQSVLDGHVSVEDVSRRCRCMVVRDHRSGWAVKQGANVETRESVTNEARAYQAIADTTISGKIPRFVHADPELGVLVVEFVDGVAPRDYENDTTEEVRARYAYQLGQLLARLHTLPVSGLGSRLPPRVLNCHRPSLQSIEFHSGASLQALAIVQESVDLRGALETVSDNWLPIAFSHNDLRGDNILVDETSGDITLIDWEMAGLADPRWDISALLAERLVAWLSDPGVWLPESGADPHTSAAAGLPRLHSFTRFLLAGYTATHSGIAESAPVASSVSTWTAARLVQAAIEHCHREATISPLAEQMLQIAANIFRRPVEAGRLFFGLEA